MTNIEDICDFFLLVGNFLKIDFDCGYTLIHLLFFQTYWPRFRCFDEIEFQSPRIGPAKQTRVLTQCVFACFCWSIPSFSIRIQTDAQWIS